MSEEKKLIEYKIKFIDGEELTGTSDGITFLSRWQDQHEVCTPIGRKEILYATAIEIFPIKEGGCLTIPLSQVKYYNLNQIKEGVD